MSYLVLARKWRPTGFDDLAGQEPIARILKNAISQGKIAHAYLFSGPRGVGKTSSARILAKAVNCKDGPVPVPCGNCYSCTAITEGSSVDVIEIDGASNNSVDDIRDLREKVKYAPSSGRYKVYIIDEVHMLSSSAFNALLKTLEEPPSHVIFVLATTALKKIPATILSRCQHMPFRRISSNKIMDRLKEISESEGISISSQALSLIAKAADGSMRDSLTILDQVSAFASEITDENIKSLLGIADLGMLSRISRAIISGNRVEILETINLLSEHGTDIRSFTKELVQFFRDLLVSSVMRKPEDVLDLSAEEMSAVRDIVSASSEEQLMLMLSEIMKAETDVRNSSSPQLALEMSLIRASFLSTMKPLKKVIENIDKYSKQFTTLEKATDNVGGDSLMEGQLSDKLTGKKEIDEQSINSSLKIKKVETEEPVIEAKPDVSLNKQTPDEISPSEDRDVSYFWKKTLERIDAPLASKISQAGLELKGNELLLTLNGGHAVFEDSISKNLRLIEEILSEESGSKIKIRIATVHKKSPPKKEMKEKLMNEPVIKEALELFDGRIVDIIHKENSENTKNGGRYV